MLLVAFVKIAFGDGITAESAHYQVRQVTETGGLLTVFLVLRAFASGCTALTGVEAVSNGVPGLRAAQEPERRDDACCSWACWRRRCSRASPRSR